MNKRQIINKRLVTQLVKPTYEICIHPFEYINANVILGCNSKCITCDYWKKKITYLSADSFKNVINMVRPYIAKDKTITLTIGGAGEPMMNKDIFDILKISTKNGLLSSMVTNSLMINESSAKKLISSGISHINLSLESIDPKINDSIRGVPNHFLKVKRAIEYLWLAKNEFESECTLGISTTVGAKNISTLPNMVKWVQQNKHISSIRFNAISQVFGTKTIDNWYEDNRYSHLWPKDKNEVLKVYNLLTKLKSKNNKIANSVRSLNAQMNYFINPQDSNKNIQKECFVYRGITVTPMGDVTLCPIDGNSKRSIGPNILFNSNNNSVDPSKIHKKIISYQTKVKNCSVNNCQNLLNCDFTGDQ